MATFHGQLKKRPLRTCATLIVVVAMLSGATAHGDEKRRPYVVGYPAAEQFTPPVEGFFDEVARSFTRVRGRTFRHQPNGGYGLPIQDKVAGQNLIHLGADVGWYRIGDPVLSVANGVVRVSQQPLPKEKKEKKNPVRGQPKVLHWGGVVAIEHRLPNDQFVTTVYGHLVSKLLVSTGDIVKAGQPIGTIGATRVNGGYKPHLHFGVRSGRMLEKGRPFLEMHLSGEQALLKVDDVTEEHIVLTGRETLPDRFQMTVKEKTFEFQNNQGKITTSIEILQHLQPMGFQVVGYGLSTDGWIDPVRFMQNPLAAVEDEKTSGLSDQ